jgi:hypothetical protein
MVLPPPLLAPVIPPMIAPMVHEKLLGADAVSEILGDVPVQIAAVGVLVTAGVGFTVTVIVNGVAAAQLPVVDVGVTMY